MIDCFSGDYCACADNSELLDLYYLLEVQADSLNGTYVANNPNLCISPPILWAGQNNSLISYSYGQVERN